VQRRFKEIVDRSTLIRVSRCQICGELLYSSYDGVEGLARHREETGHDKFEAIYRVQIFASVEDMEWMDEYGRILREGLDKTIKEGKLDFLDKYVKDKSDQ